MTNDGPLHASQIFESRAFDDLDVSGERFVGKEFFRCTFKNLRAGESTFEKCQFEKCVFDECDLTRCCLSHTSLHGVEFRGSKLLGVNFSQANKNVDISFSDCVLRYAVFDGMALRDTRFSDCQLQDAQFQKTDLVNADFTGSDLAQTVFDGCELSGADFSNARAFLLDPRANRVRDAYVSADTAAALVHAMGFRVAGYHSRAKRIRR
ncbi:MAG: pentapeptide repeat-containing protein [Sandaracinaceae bacterium]|nr:pentapeptide repeat-containing protein [Sandaracinaceae bacterium]